MPRASGLEAELAVEPTVEVELVQGGRGVFDVICDGETIFSKHAQGRFPAAGEILALLRARMDSSG